MRILKGIEGVRRICSVVILIMLLQMPAMAEVPGVEPKDINGSGTSTFTGHIPATMLSVDLPAEITFTVDPGLDLEENGFNQVKDGSGSYEVINYGGAITLSLVELNNYATEASLKDDGGAIPFTFLGSVLEGEELAAEPEGGGNLKAGAMVSLWLEAPNDIGALEAKAITPAKLSGGNVIEIGSVEQGKTTASLQVYCYAKTNFISNGFSFELVPLLKVELS